MSKYDQLKGRTPKDFKRLVGVNESTYCEMVGVYKAHERERKRDHGIGGRKSLCEEDKVLLMLSYYREYRTLRHIAFDYGVSESTASRVVRDVEKVLIQSNRFSLPSKRALYQENAKMEYVVIDATESPIQRPKKNSGIITLERKKDTRSKPRS